MAKTPKKRSTKKRAPTPAPEVATYWTVEASELFDTAVRQMLDKHERERRALIRMGRNDAKLPETAEYNQDTKNWEIPEADARAAGLRPVE